jgi:hypothetical protein
MLSKLYYDGAQRVDLVDIAKLCDYLHCKRFRYKPPHHFTYHVAGLFLMTRVCELKCFTESPTAIMLTKFVSLTLLQDGSSSSSNKSKPLFAAIDRALGSRSTLRGLLFIPATLFAVLASARIFGGAGVASSAQRAHERSGQISTLRADPI